MHPQDHRVVGSVATSREFINTVTESSRTMVRALPLLVRRRCCDATVVVEAGK